MYTVEFTDKMHNLNYILDIIFISNDHLYKTWLHMDDWLMQHCHNTVKFHRCWTRTKKKFRYPIPLPDFLRFQFKYVRNWGFSSHLWRFKKLFIIIWNSRPLTFLQLLKNEIQKYPWKCSLPRQCSSKEKISLQIHCQQRKPISLQQT